MPNYPMPVLRKILLGLLLLGVLYCAVLVAELLTTQELTRTTQTQTQEAACLMWKPRFLFGDGLCYLDVLDARGQVITTVNLSHLDTAFNALQQNGQLRFEGETITVENLRTGDRVKRFTLRDGHLQPQD